jgi:hypothetical protein
MQQELQMAFGTTRLRVEKNFFRTFCGQAGQLPTIICKNKKGEQWHAPLNYDI